MRRRGVSASRETGCAPDVCARAQDYHGQRLSEMIYCYLIVIFGVRGSRVPGPTETGVVTSPPSKVQLCAGHRVGLRLLCAGLQGHCRWLGRRPRRRHAPLRARLAHVQSESRASPRLSFFLLPDRRRRRAPWRRRRALVPRKDRGGPTARAPQVPWLKSIPSSKSKKKKKSTKKKKADKAEVKGGADKKKQDKKKSKGGSKR